MDNVNAKIKELETRLDMTENLSSQQLKAFVAEAHILESIAIFHKALPEIDKISLIKNKIKNKSNSLVYTSVDKNMRIKNVYKGSENLMNVNRLIQDYVQSYGMDINMIDINTDEAVNNSVMTNLELKKTEDYYIRKNSVLKCIVLLIIIFIVLIAIKIIY